MITAAEATTNYGHRTTFFKNLFFHFHYKKPSPLDSRRHSADLAEISRKQRVMDHI